MCVLSTSSRSNTKASFSEVSTSSTDLPLPAPRVLLRSCVSGACVTRGLMCAGAGASLVYFSVGMIASVVAVRLATLLDVIIMRAWLASGNSRSDPNYIQWRKRVLNDSLARVHIVPCSSTLQVSHSLQLPTISSSQPSSRAPSCGL